jgi:hypothetical protein
MIDKLFPIINPVGRIRLNGGSLAALTARPSASVVRPTAAATAAVVAVAVITATVVPPVEVTAAGARRTVVGSRIGSRIRSRIRSRIVELIRTHLVSPLLRPIP